MTPAIALAFLLCAADAEREGAPPDSCEQGTVTARTCQQAEAWMRAAMRPGQVLHVEACEPVETREARR